MTQGYRIYVQVLPPGEYNTKGFAYEVDAFMAEDFKWVPYDLCSDSMTALIAGGVTSRQAARIDADREKLAKDISNGLTNAIMKALKSRDLENGYKKEPQA